jgi:2-hydroxy-3-oxopropionate reductase
MTLVIRVIHQYCFYYIKISVGVNNIMTKIGFIGLGIMGKPMSKNLIKAGYQLIVSDFNKNAVSELEQLGAEVAATPKEIAEKSDIVITMLPNSPNVKQVALGENGLIEGAREGLVYIDMSSIAPAASQEVYKVLIEKGVDMLDAPVSGGEPKAIDGTISVMVGGKKEVFDKVKPVLEAMAGSVVLVGEIGAGNVTKLANQVIVALNIAAVSEAFVLSQKAGVNPEAVFEAIRGGLAGSTVLEAKAPMMLDRNFNPGFRINLHIKDLTNAMEAGHEVGAPLPLTAAVLEMMYGLKVDGHELDDHSGLLKYYEKLANTEVSR